MRVSLTCILLLFSSPLVISTMAQDKAVAGHDDAAALTIYNQSFAVVRQTLPLELKSGVNQIEVNDITSYLEPDSVILRDLKSGQELHILEQNYRSDIASQARLLSLYEGKTIDFLMTDNSGQRKLMPGKIIRSGYVDQYPTFNNPYGQNYSQAQQYYLNARSGETIVEIDGKVQFGLPGQPVFPALTNSSILKPTLSWSCKASGRAPARLSSVT